VLKVTWAIDEAEKKREKSKKIKDPSFGLKLFGEFLRKSLK
jgi:hypothetical protein